MKYPAEPPSLLNFCLVWGVLIVGCLATWVALVWAIVYLY